MGKESVVEIKPGEKKGEKTGGEAYLLSSGETAFFVQAGLLIDNVDDAVVVKIERALHVVGRDNVGRAAVRRLGSAIECRLFAVGTVDVDE